MTVGIESCPVARGSRGQGVIVVIFSHEDVVVREAQGSVIRCHAALADLEVPCQVFSLGVDSGGRCKGMSGLGPPVGYAGLCWCALRLVGVFVSRPEVEDALSSGLGPLFLGRLGHYPLSGPGAERARLMCADVWPEAVSALGGFVAGRVAFRCLLFAAVQAGLGSMARAVPVPVQALLALHRLGGFVDRSGHAARVEESEWVSRLAEGDDPGLLRKV